MITFISDVYGGRASDKLIFTESKILDLCEGGDAIMADKGYLIEDACHKAKVHLIRPPFRKAGQKQLPVLGCEETRDVAAARVHVERCFERIKNFNILKSTIAWNMFPHVRYIFNVIGGLINLLPPIISTRRFKHR